MKSIQETGMKISRAQREYYRYTGVSAEAERKGTNFSKERDFSRLREQGAPKEKAGRAAETRDEHS
jgi:hypothetical protein